MFLNLTVFLMVILMDIPMVIQMVILTVNLNHSEMDRSVTALV